MINGAEFPIPQLFLIVYQDFLGFHAGAGGIDWLLALEGFQIDNNNFLRLRGIFWTHNFYQSKYPEVERLTFKLSGNGISLSKWLIHNIRIKAKAMT